MRPDRTRRDNDRVPVGSPIKTYLLYDPFRHWVKIGRSLDVDARVRSIVTASGAELTLLGVIDSDQEAKLHKACAPARMRGEWFEVTPAVRDVVRRHFGVDVPPAFRPMTSERTKTEDAIRWFRAEWGITFQDPDAKWFAGIEGWLVEDYALYTDEDGLQNPDFGAELAVDFFLDYGHHLIAVGGTPGDGPLGLLLDDQPISPEMDDAIRQLFTVIDGYAPIYVGIASSPPREWPDRPAELAA